MIPFGFGWFVNNLFPNVLFTGPSNVLITLLVSVYYIGVVLFFYTEFIGFYLDLLIITNDRIVYVNQISIFSRSVAEMDLYQTQDVISDVKGFFPSFFHYGDVTIQNASAVTKFHFLRIPNPDKLRQLVLDLATEDRKFHAHEENEPVPPRPTLTSLKKSSST